MDKIILILFLFSQSSFAKPLHFLVVKQHRPEQIEQMSLAIYKDRAELFLNTNRWTKENYKIGKFVIKDKKVLGRIYQLMTPLKNEPKIKAIYSSAHAVEVSYSGKIILSDSQAYQYGINLFEILLNSFKWEEEHIHYYKNKEVLSIPKNKITKKYQCIPNQVALVCRGELGIIYSPFKKK